MFGFGSSTFNLKHSKGRPVYPGDLLPEAQALLTALADVEYRYETAYTFMEQWRGPAEVKQACLETFSESRKRERELLVRQLAELERRLNPPPEKRAVDRYAKGPAALSLGCA